MNENITPLPWKAGWGNGREGITGPNAAHMLMWEKKFPIRAKHKLTGDFSDPVAALHMDDPNAAANAAYIVTACNAYPALTARVKELEEKAAALVRYCDHFKDHEVTREFWLRNFQNVQHVEDLRSALNKEPTT